MSSSRTLAPSRGLPSFAALLRRWSRYSAFYPLVGLVAVSIVMVFSSDSFLSYSNLSNILRQVSINALIAVGMTFVILTGGIDLSVGAVMALAGTIAAGLMAGGLNGVVALLAGIGLGCAFGLANGAFVAFAGMPPIIVTLATMGIARGLGLIYTGGYPISGLPTWINWFGAGNVLGLQAPIAIMLVIYAVGWVLLERTPFGRYVYAIGGNETATRLSGVRVGRVKLAIYALSGFTAGIAGLITVAINSSSDANLVGSGMELDAIAAVAVGGTLLAGGRATVVGTLIGACIIQLVRTTLIANGVPDAAALVVKALLIVLAVWVQAQGRRG